MVVAVFFLTYFKMFCCLSNGNIRNHSLVEGNLIILLLALFISIMNIQNVKYLNKYYLQTPFYYIFLILLNVQLCIFEQKIYINFTRFYSNLQVVNRNLKLEI